MIGLILLATIYCDLKSSFRKIERASADAESITENPAAAFETKIVIGNTAEAASAQNYRPLIAALKRSIEATLSTINSTRNPETGINCFAALRSDIALLADETGNGKIKMGLGGTASDEMDVKGGGFPEYFEKIKKDWLRNLFLEKIENFLKRTEGLGDSVLKRQCLQNALGAAYDGLLYLSEDEELTAKASLIKEQLKALPD